MKVRLRALGCRPVSSIPRAMLVLLISLVLSGSTGPVLADAPLEIGNLADLRNRAALTAFLGDAWPRGSLDRDAFRFRGGAGETIAVTLTPDGAGSSTGEIATLRVRGEDGAILIRRQGTVPLQLTVTLPATGTYQIEAIEVADSAGSAGAPFRGHYRLEVTSTSEVSLGLEPAITAEP